MRRSLLVSFVFLLFFANVFAQNAKIQPVTAILGAFHEEVRLLQASLKDRKEQKIQGLLFVTGLLNGRRVVVAETGVGKVNAAMTTALVVQVFAPREILFSGIAGGVNPDLMPGDMVIARQVTHHDYGSITFDKQPTQQTMNPVTARLNPQYFPADSALLVKAAQAAQTTRFEKPVAESRLPNVVTGIVVTGDVFVASAEKVRQLRRDFNADATEMEGAAVAQVCWQFNTPCLIIRSLSDKADENARGDMMAFYKTAARNSAALVTAIAGMLK